LSANALLMAYIGGNMVFAGPILGAVLITLLQSGVSLMSNSWLIYVGVLFIAMVTFAPAGLTGIIMAHAPIWRAGRISRLILPYLRLVVPGIAAVTGFVGMVELLSFLTIGAAAGKQLVLFGSPIDVNTAAPWLVATVLLVVGTVWLRFEARYFARVWESVAGGVEARA
jgi:branched-chain amino acid transport system permease protein